MHTYGLEQGTRNKDDLNRKCLVREFQQEAQPEDWSKGYSS